MTARHVELTLDESQPLWDDVTGLVLDQNATVVQGQSVVLDLSTGENINNSQTQKATVPFLSHGHPSCAQRSQK